MKRLIKTIFWVTLFAIAMGFMESAIVIYLRELYYTTGFTFPLKPMSAFIARVEFFRELATIVMLIAVGFFVGKNKLQKFAYFIFAFAIWDLFYYLFLFVCLGWPQTLTTWDILFLIPVPWVGPVWAPCLLALLMIIGSLFVIAKTEKEANYTISASIWCFLIVGAFVCMLSFMWDYLCYTNFNNLLAYINSDKKIFSELEFYVPSSFNKALFFGGFLLMVVPLIYLIYDPSRCKNSSELKIN